MARLTVWLLLAAAAPITLARAGERAVAPGGLAAALASAPPGETLRLLPGVHPGPLTVDRPVRLVAEPGAVIEGNGSGTALTLAADGIAIVGAVIRGSGADLSADDAAVLLYRTRDVTVQGCQIEARAFGIYLREGRGNHIVDNTVRGDASLPVARRGNGIHLWQSSENEISGNRLLQVRDGIYFSFAHRNLIRANQGSALRYGIHYMYSERNQLFENRFSGCRGGITLMFSRSNEVRRNQTTGNRDFGILCLQLERSTLAGNQISGNGRGLFVENSAGNRFVENRLSGNGVGAFLTAGSEENLFTLNRFEGNLVQVFQQHAARNHWAEDARGNFWSDYVGFDWDGDGVGEAPYRLQTAASALMARRPVVRWFWMSPVLALIDWLDSWMGPARGGSDPAPLVGKVVRRAKKLRTVRATPVMGIHQ